MFLFQQYSPRSFHLLPYLWWLATLPWTLNMVISATLVKGTQTVWWLSSGPVHTRVYNHVAPDVQAAQKRSTYLWMGQLALVWRSCGKSHASSSRRTLLLFFFCTAVNSLPLKRLLHASCINRCVHRASTLACWTIIVFRISTHYSPFSMWCIWWYWTSETTSMS